MCECGEKISEHLECECCSIVMCGECSDNACHECEKVFCNKIGCTPLYVCENEKEEVKLCHWCAIELIDDMESEWKMDFAQMKLLLDFQNEN